MAFRADKRKLLAAVLVAEGSKTGEQIALEVGVSRKTLCEWRQRPEFQAWVDEELERIAEEVRRKPIANVMRRVAAYQRRWEKFERLIEERAAAHDGEAPGAGTGLLVRQVKLIKVYKSSEDAEPEQTDGEALVSAKCEVPVVEFTLDAALLREMRATEQQAAQELGQWEERKRINVRDLSDEQIIQLLEAEAAAGGAEEGPEGPNDEAVLP